MTVTALAQGVDHHHPRGPWMTMASGKRFYPFDPRPEDVDLSDIAHHLANQCRFNGATTRFYSTAEHSLLCWMLAAQHDKRVMKQALLHDAAEAYVGDVVTPLKSQLPEFCMIEDRIMEHAICPAFDLPWPLDPVVKRIDMIACATEKRDLLPTSEEWPNMPNPDEHVNVVYPLDFNPRTAFIDTARAFGC